MHTSIIICERLGQRIPNVKVALEFTFEDHPLSAGFTKTFYSDKDGIAYVEHANTGRAYVWTNGHKKKKPFDAPGTFTVFPIL